MPEFKVSITELWHRLVTVEAESREGAIAEVLRLEEDGELDYLYSPEYLSTFEPDGSGVEDLQWEVFDA